MSALQGGRLLHGKLGGPDDAAQGCGDRRGAGCHRGGETTGTGNRRYRAVLLEFQVTDVVMSPKEPSE